MVSEDFGGSPGQIGRSSLGDSDQVVDLREKRSASIDVIGGGQAQEHPGAACTGGARQVGP